MPTRRIPHLGHVCLFLLLCLISLLLAEVIVMGATGGFHNSHTAMAAALDQRLQIIANIVTYLIALALCAVVFPLLWKRPFLDGIQWHARAVKPLLAAFGLVVGFIAQGVSSFLPAPKDLPIEALFRNPALIWILAFFGTFLAPLFEELFFRGFLLPAIAIAYDYIGLRKTSDPLEDLTTLDTWRSSDAFSTNALVFASVITSLCFAGIHAPQLGFSWASVALLAVVSLGLCYVRIRLRSLAASTLVHSSYNLSVFITLFISTGGFRHLEKVS
jgi:membrane protease YdiL (CAAX protease family)